MLQEALARENSHQLQLAIPVHDPQCKQLQPRDRGRVIEEKDESTENGQETTVVQPWTWFIPSLFGIVALSGLVSQLRLLLQGHNSALRRADEGKSCS
jgi:hypothetical protein